MWFVIDGEVVTPKYHCLKGITAKNVMKSLENQTEFKYCYRDIHASEIYKATEAFITSRLDLDNGFNIHNLFLVREISGQ